jgi:hypothetical protein
VCSKCWSENWEEDSRQQISNNSKYAAHHAEKRPNAKKTCRTEEGRWNTNNDTKHVVRHKDVLLHNLNEMPRNI